MPLPQTVFTRHRTGLSIAASIAALSLLLSFPRTALADVWVETANRIGVTPQVLHGIALTESGRRWTDGVVRPWPWTLNSPVMGSQYFNSKEEAVVQLRQLLSAGHTNVDIGLMQVNCGYHCSRVADPAQLFDPATNIRVAGQILMEVRKATPNLAAAVGAYHAGLHPNRAARSQWYQNVVADRIRRLSRTNT